LTAKIEKSIALKHGRLAEDKALDYLRNNSLKFTARNFHAPYGEIDLIMHDKNIIVFIEVRYRVNNNFVSALESIDGRKCDRIIATSQFYQQHNLNAAKMITRFDVVVITGKIKMPKIEWIKNAFQA
jgi:putative endonuclease